MVRQAHHERSQVRWLGRLLGIARRDVARGPMEAVETADISTVTGVALDARGFRGPNSAGKRQVTILAREDWQAACADAGRPLDWLESRRNLYVADLPLAGTAGGRVRIGGALLEITGECDPCWKMDRALPGLQAAMRPDWRGGITCRVLEDGRIAVGDPVILET